MRVELEGTAIRFERLFQPLHVKQINREPVIGRGIVRFELNGPAKLSFSLAQFPTIVRQNEPQGRVGLRQRIVELKSLRRLLLRKPSSLLRNHPSVVAHDAVAVCHPCVGQREGRIELHRLFEVSDRLLDAFLASLVPVVSPLEIERVGFRTCGGTLPDLLLLPLDQMDLQRGRHLLCDVTLDGEDVCQVPVVALRPQVPVVLGLYQLGCDPDLVPRFPHAPLQDAPNRKLPPDLRDGDRGVSVSHYRSPRYHLKLPYLGYGRDYLLGHSIGKVSVVWVRAHVGEGKNSQTVPVERRAPCLPLSFHA